MTKPFTTIVSNIAATDTVELEEAEDESGAVSQLVEAFEEQLSNVELDVGKELSIAEPNVAVQVLYSDNKITYLHFSV